MVRRTALVVLLAALLVSAGCSQLASTPNEQGDTQTVAEGNANATAANETTSGTTPAATETVQGQVTTSPPAGQTTATPSPTGTATPSPTATKTATPSPTATETPTRTATPSPTASPSPTPEPKYVVIIGGDPDEKVNYRMVVSGTIERRGASYGAPIDDEDVTADPDIDIIDGSSVAGRLGGGGDAYRITGDITSFEAEGDVEVYVDGERVDVSDGDADDEDS